MIPRIAILLAITSFNGNAHAQVLAPEDAGLPETVPGNDTPIKGAIVGNDFYIVAQQPDSRFVTHSVTTGGTALLPPEVKEISTIKGQFIGTIASGTFASNFVTPRVDLLSGAQFFPPFNTRQSLHSTAMYGVDSTGGVTTAGTDPGYWCPGMNQAEYLPEVDLFNSDRTPSPNDISSATIAINCNLRRAIGIFMDPADQTFKFFSSNLDSTITSFNQIDSIPDAQFSNFSSHQLFAEIGKTAFHSRYSELTQGPNAQDICVLSGSEGSTYEFQADEKCLSLTSEGAVFQNSGGQCMFLDAGLNRRTLLSNGAPYSNCIDGDLDHNKILWVTVAGSTIYYQHQLKTGLEDLTCIDTDGDGWGWDGQASCEIESFDDTQYGCIDTDGDGWGWNGLSSCQPPEDTGIMPCIDTDGDGWGWTGTASCRLADTR